MPPNPTEAIFPRCLHSRGCCEASNKYFIQILMQRNIIGYVRLFFTYFFPSDQVLSVFFLFPCNKNRQLPCAIAIVMPRRALFRAEPPSNLSFRFSPQNSSNKLRLRHACEGHLPFMTCRSGGWMCMNRALELGFSAFVQAGIDIENIRFCKCPSRLKNPGIIGNQWPSVEIWSINIGQSCAKILVPSWLERSVFQSLGAWLGWIGLRCWQSLPW